MAEAFDWRATLREIPHQPGVYLMKDHIGGVIYVGKARDLKRRVSSYFMPSQQLRASPKTRALIKAIRGVDFHVVRNEEESLLLEAKLIKDYRPRYNVALRDDKRFLMVRVKPDDPCPRLQTTRTRRDDGARYFGPYPHSAELVATVEWLNRTLGLRTCKARVPGEAEYRHCHADLIRNCSAPCVGTISPEDYRARIAEACRILEGKGKKELLEQLRSEMEQAAAALEFERAASLRDVLKNLQKTLVPTRQFTRGKGLPTTIKPLEDLAELGEFLNLPGPPRVMECFDISNVSSNHIVASMVRFTDGVPDSQNYRRYRIAGVRGQNDFASMAEVIRRRYARILRESVAAAPEVQESQLDAVATLRELARTGKAPIVLPDLVIVDGGKGQLSMATRELQALGLHQLPIIGLAKQREEVFLPDRSEPILIPHDRGALKLLQRIRDEAHRFANLYNALLYRRRMTESLLDDCPGVSEAKKLRLLQAFGSVSRIRRATVNEIAALPGFSSRSAQTILDHLQRSSGTNSSGSQPATQ